MKIIFLTFLIFGLVASASAQTAPAADAAALELAKKALVAHGGDKLTKINTSVLRGSVDVSVGGTAQTLPASFAIVTAGDKYRLEIQSMMFNFRQVFDGANVDTSVPGVYLPPVTRVGMMVLPLIEKEGFVVSAYGDKSKKKNGFRVTAPEGYYTDFVVDEKTFLIKEYSSSYEVGGRTVSTAVAIDKYKDIDGVLINEKFSQRIDMGQFTSYASFNAKEISLNSPVADDVFTMQDKN